MICDDRRFSCPGIPLGKPARGKSFRSAGLIQVKFIGGLTAVFRRRHPFLFMSDTFPIIKAGKEMSAREQR